jgi:hypothetical protein
MMKKFIPPVIILSVLSLAAFLSIVTSNSASAYSIMEGVNAARGSNVPATLFGGTGIITTIINTMLFIAGALSVIMIIFGGLRYVTSAGNSSNVTAAKNTVMYAIIGLIVAFLAYAAVNFVLGAVESGGQLAPSNR